jgi:hypothetical protein
MKTKYLLFIIYAILIRSTLLIGAINFLDPYSGEDEAKQVPPDLSGQVDNILVISFSMVPL